MGLGVAHRASRFFFALPFERSQMEKTAQPSDERKKVGMIVPPPVLLIGLVVVCAVAQSLWLGWTAISPLRAALGTILIALSTALIASCGKLFRRVGTPVRPTSPTTAIVKEGPYRFTRNPMYVGMAGILAGLALLAGSYPIAGALVIFLAVLHFGVILPEERYLEALHGRTYVEYKEQVRRWF